MDLSDVWGAIALVSWETRDAEVAGLLGEAFPDLRDAALEPRRFDPCVLASIGALGTLVEARRRGLLRGVDPAQLIINALAPRFPAFSSRALEVASWVAQTWRPANGALGKILLAFAEKPALWAPRVAEWIDVHFPASAGQLSREDISMAWNAWCVLKYYLETSTGDPSALASWYLERLGEKNAYMVRLEAITDAGMNFSSLPTKAFLWAIPNILGNPLKEKHTFAAEERIRELGAVTDVAADRLVVLVANLLQMMGKNVGDEKFVDDLIRDLKDYMEHGDVDRLSCGWALDESLCEAFEYTADNVLRLRAALKAANFTPLEFWRHSEERTLSPEPSVRAPATNLVEPRMWSIIKWLAFA
jgi:hypothetical protein